MLSQEVLEELLIGLALGQRGHVLSIAAHSIAPPTSRWWSELCLVPAQDGQRFRRIGASCELKDAERQEIERRAVQSLRSCSHRAQAIARASVEQLALPTLDLEGSASLETVH